jgi:kynurenine formamidase
MFVDLTVTLTSENLGNADLSETLLKSGHLGTHFDVMNKTFPLEYLSRSGIVFHVKEIRERDIETEDIDLSLVQKDDFVLFHTGWIEEKGYGNKDYFHDHPQLSDALIDALLEKGISMIGVDAPGIRRGKEHTPKDQYCADHGVFVVENLCHLEEIHTRCRIYTFPLKIEGPSGLPCRAAAEL